MKMILVLLNLICLQTAFAQIALIKEGDTHLSRPSAKILSLNNSVAKVEVTMNGCVDRFGGYFAKIEMVDKKNILHLGAMNISNIHSDHIQCFVPPTQIIEVAIPSEDEVELAPMDYQQTDLKHNDLHLNQANAKVLSVNKICPPNPGGVTCMAYGSWVTIEVQMTGCVDRMGGHFSQFEVINGKGYLHFGAVNIFNQVSTFARCLKMPTEEIKIMVPFEGKIELLEMELKI